MDDSLNKAFSIDEIRSLLPWLREVSESSELALIRLQQNGSADRAQEQAAAIIQHWAETVAKLGGMPKQPFTVDFDSGHDFFCWEYPEDDIYFRHDYNLGYQGRHPICDGPIKDEEVNP